MKGIAVLILVGLIYIWLLSIFSPFVSLSFSLLFIFCLLISLLLAA